MLHFGVRMGARQNVDRRVRSACLDDDLSGLESIWYRQNQLPGSNQIGRRKYVAIGGVADDGLDIVIPQPGDGLVGIFNNEERLASFLERLANETAYPAVADEHRMIGQRGGLHFLHGLRLDSGMFGRIRNRLGCRRPLFQPGFEICHRGKYQRIDEDRQDGAAKDEVASLLRQHAKIDAKLGENEGESPICARLAEMMSAVPDG